MMMHGMSHSEHSAPAAQTGSEDDAQRLLAILRRRYAEGDVTEEEFDERKRVLGLEGAAPAVAHSHG
jgi:uncharacterized membrane protein